MISQNDIFVKNKDLAWRQIDDEILIVPLQRNAKNDLFSLNKTATIIWNLIDGKHSLGQIVRKVYDIYKIKDNEPRKQIYTFVEKMYREGLIYKKRKQVRSNKVR